MIQHQEENLWLGLEPDVAAHILQPVLQNACGYGHTTVSLALSQTGSTVAIEIADDGPGVTAAEAEAIFRPGYRGTAATVASDGTTGAGLGLSLARRLAEAVQGEVSVVPGSTGLFVVSLPAS
jgi:signal transduction histidine kinase